MVSAGWAISPDVPPLFSRHWYRVASLKPTFATGVQVRAQRVRGQNWYVLTRPGHNRRIRINESAYAVLGRCDGKVTLDEVFRCLLKLDAEALPAQEDFITLAGKLIGDGYLQCANWPKLQSALHEQQSKARREVRERLNPLAPRLSLGSPDRLLSTLDSAGRAAFSRSGLMLWLLVLACSAISIFSHWPALNIAAAHLMSSPKLWLYALICYPLIKLIHEVGHGLAIRRWGGHVHEAGIGLLLFFPAPYVDASDAGQFARASQRAWVSAAGIAVELAIAAAALIVWPWLAPGLLTDLLLASALIASVSTLFFNANPLVRLDGYYVISDLAQMPNLASRSQKFWRETLHRHLLGLQIQPFDYAPVEYRWLLLYSPLSWLYRISIMSWVVWWLGAYSKGLGLLIALAAALWLVVLPVWRLITAPSQSGASLPARFRSYTRLTLAAAGFAVALLLPLPDRAMVQGVVWTSDDSVLRATHSGFLTELLVTEGAPVKPGTAVFGLTDPKLETDIAALRSRLPGLQSVWLANLRTNTERARHAQEQIRQASARLAHLSQQKERLRVNAARSGRLRLNAPWSDLAGSFVREGDILGYATTDEPPVVRAALSQKEAARIRAVFNGDAQHMRTAIEMVHTPGKTLPAEARQLVTAAVTTLPSASMALSNGGSIALDPNAQGELKPASPTYLLDVATTEIAHAALGSRAWVRIDYGYTSLLSQGVRQLRQMVSTRMSAQWD